MNTKLKASFDDIVQHIKSIRACGLIRSGCHFLTENEKRVIELLFSQDSEIKFINNYIASQGFVVPDIWTHLNPTLARLTLADHIEYDQAYRVAGASHDESITISSEFIQLFNEKNVLFLSNEQGYKLLKSGDGNASGFNPLTEATFDGGVIGFDNDFIAYIWFEDED